MSREIFAAIKHIKAQKNIRKIFVFFCIFLWLFVSSCTDLQKPAIEQFYGEIKPPKKQEFRWSNGKLPKQLDPALASAPPETDLVRAVYEGLTDLDAKTLEAKPSIAERWDISDDGRTWTFYLRKDARWSNGEPVVARDFARSWRRLAEMGSAVPHSKLLKNIVGAENFAIDDGISVLPDEEFEPPRPEEDPGLQQDGKTPRDPADPANPPSSVAQPETSPSDADLNSPRIVPPPPAPVPVRPQQKRSAVNKWLGVDAVNDTTLRVWLIWPDRNFAAVVAHPIFRPVYEDPDSKEVRDLDLLEHSPRAVTNGAFKVASVSGDEVVLSRSESFWEHGSIGLEKVRLIAKPDAEAALAAYQANEIDAISNTHLEPLAQKLLTPYEDFRQTTHNALTFYQFNTRRKPFDNILVRKALALALRRETIVQDEMDGAAEPALEFLPLAADTGNEIKESPADARRMLFDAGYKDPAEFPVIRLLINRNDLQRRIANTVAKAWQRNLGVKTEVIIKDREEYEAALKAGDYDLVRRGIVLPTASEASSLLAMFDAMLAGNEDDEMELLRRKLEEFNNRKLPAGEEEQERYAPLATPTPDVVLETSQENSAAPPELPPAAQEKGKADAPSKIILTEKQALEFMPAIPLYFPVSNSLVKPYVSGFETNLLDAPSLKTVVINDKWKENKAQK
jgi:ABC-type oligopeptide transport system substrate-binding subunit